MIKQYGLEGNPNALEIVKAMSGNQGAAGRVVDQNNPLYQFLNKGNNTNAAQNNNNMLNNLVKANQALYPV